MRFPEVEAVLTQLACDVACGLGLGLAAALALCLPPALAAARGLPLRTAWLTLALVGCIPLTDVPPVLGSVWCAMTVVALLPRRRDRVRAPAS